MSSALNERCDRHWRGRSRGFLTQAYSFLWFALQSLMQSTPNPTSLTNAFYYILLQASSSLHAPQNAIYVLAAEHLLGVLICLLPAFSCPLSLLLIQKGIWICQRLCKKLVAQKNQESWLLILDFQQMCLYHHPFTLHHPWVFFPISMWLCILFHSASLSQQTILSINLCRCWWVSFSQHPYRRANSWSVFCFPWNAFTFRSFLPFYTGLGNLWRQG